MLSSFGASTLILFFLFLCGLGAVFQPVVLLVLFLRGLGLGVMGVYAYSAGQAMWYLAVLLPEAILTSILMIAAAGEALRFSVRFFVQLLPEGTNRKYPDTIGKYRWLSSAIFNFIPVRGKHRAAFWSFGCDFFFFVVTDFQKQKRESEKLSSFFYLNLLKLTG